jgi:hypothetical protein
MRVYIAGGKGAKGGVELGGQQSGFARKNQICPARGDGLDTAWPRDHEKFEIFQLSNFANRTMIRFGRKLL